MKRILGFGILIIMALTIFCFEEYEVMVPMRDSVNLATTVYLPSGLAPPFPVILQRTPYNRHEDAEIVTTICDIQRYAFVSQNLRGTADSEGHPRMFLTDAWGDLQDGYDCAEWLSEQDFCDGNIGMMGASAPGMTQYMAAGAYHPAIKCIVPIFAGPSMYHDVAYHGGCLRKVLVEAWLTGVGAPHLIDTVCNHANYDEMWATVNLDERIEEASVPCYHVAGWYDMYTDGQLRIYNELQAEHGNQKLLMAPCGHGFAAGSREQGDLVYPENVLLSVEDMMMMASGWYSYWLRGGPSEIVDEPPVTFYLTGDVDAEDTLQWNHWVDSETWPPYGTRDVNFYLHSECELDSLLPGNFDSLGYTYDPEDPSPTHGGRDYEGMDETGYGPKDQTPVESRDDCLIFETPVLEEPLTVTGKIRMVLYASSDRLDTDFAVRVTDVYPDGGSYLMTDGILMARHRLGFDREEMLEPGEIDSFYIDVFSIGHVFNAGHKMRIIVSSANYPRFEKNPNTGAEFRRDDPDMLIAHNKVFLGGEYASHLIVPVADRDLWNIEENRSRRPESIELSCMPNPFNAALSINAPSAEKIEIYDISGKRVYSTGSTDKGTIGNFIWKPGEEASSGVYLIRAISGNRISTRNAMLVK